MAADKPTRITEPSAEAMEQQVDRVLRQLRAALSTLLQAIPTEAEIRKPTQLQNALGIHSKLAWQVYKVATAGNPLSEARNIPGPAAMGRFLKAAGRSGVPVDVVNAVTDAMAQLDAVIRESAGDRSVFDSILSGLSQDGGEQYDLPHKRAAFKAQSHFLGVQARTCLGCSIYRPSEEDPDRLDCALMRGMIGLRFLRRNTSWLISQTRVSDEDSVVRQQVLREALDPDADAKQGVNLLTQFCSRPLPNIRQREVPGGITNVEIVGEAIGNTSAITCVVGDSFRRAFGRYRDDHNLTQFSQAAVRTPCEVLISDILVHRSLGWPTKPDLKIFTDHRAADPTVVGRECDELPMQEAVVPLGSGATVLSTPDVPRYVELVEWALDRLGWDDKEFDVYRCRVEYPIMPSSVVVQFPLPEKAETR